MTTEYLRKRYRELLEISHKKQAVGESIDTELEELQQICYFLLQRGYQQNADASDWVLALSPKAWRVQDAT